MHSGIAEQRVLDVLHRDLYGAAVCQRHVETGPHLRDLGERVAGGVFLDPADPRREPQISVEERAQSAGESGRRYGHDRASSARREGRAERSLRRGARRED